MLLRADLVPMKSVDISLWKGLLAAIVWHLQWSGCDRDPDRDTLGSPPWHQAAKQQWRQRTGCQELYKCPKLASLPIDSPREFLWCHMWVSRDMRS
jgi:hypothetical protein